MPRLPAKGAFGKVDLVAADAEKRTSLFTEHGYLEGNNLLEGNFAATLRDSPQAWPHLIKVRSVVVDTLTGDVVTSMEAGEHTLEHRLRTLSRVLQRSEAYSCMAQVRAGLLSMHRRGLMHGDLKPCNIMVMNHEGSVHLKLIDFGTNRRVEPQQLEQAYCGTYSYAAPESLDRPQVPTKAWDAWALGCLIYRLIYGVNYAALPMEQSELPEAYASFHTEMQSRSQDSRFGVCPEDVPSRLFNYMQGLLKHDPAKRYRVENTRFHVVDCVLLDPAEFHMVSDERCQVIAWFYRLFPQHQYLIPLAVNMMDRYCDIVGGPANWKVLRSCMCLAETLLRPDSQEHRLCIVPDRREVMHVINTLEFRLYAATMLSKLLDSKLGEDDIDHDRVREILCEEGRALWGLHLYKTRP